MAAGRSLCSPFLSVSSESVTGSQPGGVGPSYLLDKALRALEADSCLRYIKTKVQGTRCKARGDHRWPSAERKGHREKGCKRHSSWLIVNSKGQGQRAKAVIE